MGRRQSLQEGISEETATPNLDGQGNSPVCAVDEGEENRHIDNTGEDAPCRCFKSHSATSRVRACASHARACPFPTPPRCFLLGF